MGSVQSVALDIHWENFLWPEEFREVFDFPINIFFTTIWSLVPIPWPLSLNWCLQKSVEYMMMGY